MERNKNKVITIPSNVDGEQDIKISYQNNGTSQYSTFIDDSLDLGIKEQSGLSHWVLEIDGMSGKCYRHFINNLASKIKNCRYLEVGAWKGSTSASCLYNNHVKATIIENFSQFGGPKNDFLANMLRLEKECGIKQPALLEEDFRKVTDNHPSSLLKGKYNLYFFDGPHSEQDQFDAIDLMLPYLDNEFIYIVDDYNWPKLALATNKAIEENNLTVVKKVEITCKACWTPNDGGKFTKFHNGYGIFILKKLSNK